jgi:molecular chaperone GrpE (heat shock protein)
MAGILALLQALPEFLKLMNMLGNAISRLNAYAKENNIQQWILDLEHSIDQLEQAKTPDEKISAAKRLLDSVRNIR